MATTALEILTVSGVRGYEENGTVYLNAEDTARGLGFIEVKKDRVATSGDNYSSVRWNRVNGYLQEFGYPHEVEKDDYIPENIFYRLAMKAKNEAAQRFQILVSDEILPTIRRHGAYITPAALENIIADPAFGIRLLTALQEERAGREAAEAKVAEHEETINNLAPYAEHGIRCMSSPNSITVGELANRLNQNGYRTGQNRLFQDLVSRWYLYRRGKEYRAYQRYLATDTNEGLFDYTYVTFPVGDDPNGGSYIQVKVTSHGQKYFERLYTPSDDTEE